jgi:phospholipase/carboxylesterase
MLVLLHGVGSNELAMAALMEWFDPRFIVVSARAPIELEPFSFAWLHVTFTPDGPIIEGDEAVAACRDAVAFIDEAVAAYGADPDRVYLAGFSQGGIVGLGTLLTAPDKVAGVVCMSGRLPPELLPHVASRDRLRDRSVLLVHGVHDQTLGIAYARSARTFLETLPLDLDYREFDMGHTTTDESMAVVAAWLTARLGS